MSSKRTRFLVCVAGLAIAAWMAPSADAEQISTAIYLDVDTSGSMLRNVADTQYCYGDGSVEHPHRTDIVCESRMHIAKNAMTTTINGYPEVMWGLARFRQSVASQRICMCSSQNDVHSSEEPDSCDFPPAWGYNYTYDLPSGSDPVCINYSGGWGAAYCGSGSGCSGAIQCCDCYNQNVDMAGADILVALALDNENLILSWLDHAETDFRAGTDPTTGNHCYSGGYGDCELRGVAGTPIAGSLDDLYTQLSTTDLGNDPYRGCRPYSVILLTDGDETCGGTPANSAAALTSTPDMQNTCVNNSQCPPNSICDTINYAPGRCVYEVKTHVIAFAQTLLTQADAIAAAGNTGSAIPAWNESEIVSAMAGIIAESIVQELCNGADDDCDTLIDEDFPIGQPCDNGLPGICFGTGTYICDPADDTDVVCDISPAPPVPGSVPEVCNGLDDDCDGEVDEGGVCTCNGPELCNGFDDYCDGYSTELEGAEDPNVGSPCGTDVGYCTSGVLFCDYPPAQPNLAQLSCTGRTAIPEVCDANTEDGDQDCTGTNNDGIAPQPCTISNGFGDCDGMRTCDVDGNWTCWAQTPAAETCNNVDDDCDGSIDEGLSRPCSVTNAEGTCTGVETCTLGVWGGCTAATPLPEVCDGVDQNCDGQADEGLTQACQINNAFGTCTGTETCSAGSWINCTAQTPAAEICNNLDDDCDGSVDENVTQPCYSGPAGTQGVGPCSGGTQTCTAGAWGGCVGEVVPTTEQCNGIDDDCDGTPDDGFGQISCGQGACLNTIDVCQGGSLQTCTPLPNQSPETCDGADNDCDGIIDGITQACYTYATGCTFAAGAWTCNGTCATGTQICPAGGGGTWNPCQFDIGPGTEVCDGQDNDCDGQTDENLTETCYPLGYGPNTGCTAPGVCPGACQEGTRTCSGGAWSSCGGAVTPIPETCNGVDDDCDGFTDEGLTQPCQVTNAFGTCTGTESCSGGSWQACTAATPAAEQCDNIDNDCDGAVDENVTQTCYTGPPATQGVGACTDGTQTCTAGVWGSCNGETTPVPETCNGVDDDCDGSVDEDAAGNPLTQACYSGAAGTEGVGVCTGGTRTCTGGAWGPCLGEVVPSAEQCNNLDDDCDTQVDEGLGQTTCGLGVCLHTVDNCVNGVSQTCDPYANATTEICDGLDNNCDGQVDDLQRACYGFASGCTETSPGVFNCQGNCLFGYQFCPLGGPGTWGACLYDEGPAPEVCDGQDNDCDGSVDEDAAGNPLSQDCYPPGSGPSTGCTWDASNLQWDCLGLCTAGSRECTGGVWGTCIGHVTPAVEVCDGSDNDCDGDIDEPQDIPGLNQPCGTALGRCTPGVLLCINSQEVCQGGDGPFPGTCNGQDDDCDGEIDEPDEVSAEEGLPCGESEGACEPGLTQCVGGAIQCVGGVLPIEEVCDGLDNDCDGDIDDDAPCPPQFWCVQADCRPECDPTSEFPCPVGLVCTEVDVGTGQMEYVCIPDTGGDCGGVTCPEGWICQNDVCVDPCDPSPCQPWEDCVEGACIDNSCTGIGQSCPSGEFCVNHECVGDPCLSATCDSETEVCVRDCDAQSCDYSCSPLCTCPPGQVCDGAGDCMEDPCFGVECELDERCNPDTGSCEDDPCAPIYCSGWQVCFEGGCIDNPCGNVDCPEFYDCEIFTDTSDGTPVPEPRCVADPAYYTPGSDGDKFLATGAGGCQCQSSGPGGLPAGLLLMLLGWGVFRRRRSARKGGAK